MGPDKYRGIGWNALRSGTNAAPTAPGNGSGGAGSLGVTPGSFDVSSAAGELSDALTGRITLGVINVTILALLAFYIYTRSSQAGA